ncbi:MAG: DUF951 domain-containing protein [Bacillota bacterium]|nr:DUF951 domain-containing protein [Bacillota bacterium]
MKGGPIRFHLGDVIELKRQHPCGSASWEVLRTGADLRLRCTGCGRVVLLPRSRVEQRLVRILASPLGDDPSGL